MTFFDDDSVITRPTRFMTYAGYAACTLLLVAIGGIAGPLGVACLSSNLNTVRYSDGNLEHGCSSRCRFPGWSRCCAVRWGTTSGYIDLLGLVILDETKGSIVVITQFLSLFRPSFLEYTLPRINSLTISVCTVHTPSYTLINKNSTRIGSHLDIYIFLCRYFFIIS